MVRTVQPVLLELEGDVEEAAASLGASRATTFRRVILPSLVPAIAAGSSLGFARALSEFGSLVLIAGMMANKDAAAFLSNFTGLTRHLIAVPIPNREVHQPLSRALGFDPAQPRWATTGTVAAQSGTALAVQAAPADAPEAPSDIPADLLGGAPVR